MPLKSYLLMHPAAKLSDADKKAICDWTEQERKRTAAAASQVETTTRAPEGSGTGAER